ncbi:hypothetical protein Cgig2_032239 [Carnegiea gigantea]|uniref:Protein Ycf2 n=1 Tax=Carnegiea gigantea TaxID=171969 RepID=A0A9Q1GUE6_9CARY|nr:hypothetical protein Cgig2_032239 [Carnegiea gigantea]
MSHHGHRQMFGSSSIQSFTFFLLLERRVFLVHYQTITYSQISCGANSFHFSSHGKPFSLRLDLSPSPSRGILVMGSIEIGRSYLVKYLATNSYFPFITVFLRKFLRTKETKIIFDYDTDDEMDDIENGPRTRKSDNELDNSYDSDVDVEKERRYIAMDQDADHTLFKMEKRTDPFCILFQF